MAYIHDIHGSYGIGSHMNEHSTKENCPLLGRKYFGDVEDPLSYSNGHSMLLPATCRRQKKTQKDRKEKKRNDSFSKKRNGEFHITILPLTIRKTHLFHSYSLLPPLGAFGTLMRSTPRLGGSKILTAQWMTSDIPFQ